jgi:hypothetical protein
VMKASTTGIDFKSCLICLGLIKLGPRDGSNGGSTYGGLLRIAVAGVQLAGRSFHRLGAGQVSSRVLMGRDLKSLPVWFFSAFLHVELNFSHS